MQNGASILHAVLDVYKAVRNTVEYWLNNQWICGIRGFRFIEKTHDPATSHSVTGF